MKNIHGLFLMLFMLCISTVAFSQIDSSHIREKQLVRLVKTDKGELLGYIVSEDAREILFDTKDGRRIYIPQHTIAEIIVVKNSELDKAGQFLGEETFATRYFLTTNGLPLKKGQHYVQWNLFGPDLQFSLGDNFGVGLMTTWIGAPIVVNAKKSFKLAENTYLAVGALAGSFSYIDPDFYLALPFASISYGDRMKNIAFSAGYGNAWLDGESNGRFITSIAGMVKITPRTSLIFDSFIVMRGASQETVQEFFIFNPATGQNERTTRTVTERGGPPVVLIIPGVRWNYSSKSAFQFGFTGIAYDGEFGAAIPLVQWFTAL